MLTAFLVLLAPALASNVKVASWGASSTAPAGESQNFEPTNLGDGKQSTAWVEGEDGGGLGSWITADLGGEKTIAAVTVWGSNWYNTEYWGHYNRPKTVVLEFSDGSTEELTLKDEYAPQAVSLKSPKKTSTVKMRVKGVYSGKGVDTAISEVRFSDTAGDGPVPVSGTTASSSAVADVDGDYDAANVSDGITDSMWCEGNKKSDGTGEWLDLTLGRRSSVSALKVRSGAGFSADLFKKVNRPLTATVSFSDGTAESVTLKDMPFEQTISFSSSHTSDRVKLSFTSAKKGTDYDDMCVSEITVVP